MEQLEADQIFRNQQVAGSSPAGGSIKIKKLLPNARVNGWYFGWYFFGLAASSFRMPGTTDPAVR
jgi:hypothetical protein